MCVFLGAAQLDYPSKHPTEDLLLCQEHACFTGNKKDWSDRSEWGELIDNVGD